MSKVKLISGETVKYVTPSMAERMFEIQVKMRAPEWACWKLADDRWIYEDNKLRYVIKPDTTKVKATKKPAGD